MVSVLQDEGFEEMIVIKEERDLRKEPKREADSIYSLTKGEHLGKGTRKAQSSLWKRRGDWKGSYWRNKLNLKRGEAEILGIKIFARGIE